MSARDTRGTRGQGAGWRLALRLARREALRRRGQTALMLLLVCLPVVAVTAAAIVYRTADLTSAESIQRRMGSAQAVVVDAGTVSVHQRFDPDDAILPDGAQRTRPVTTAEVKKALGRADVLPFVQGRALVTVPGGRLMASTYETELDDPLTRGLFDLRSGRYPTSSREVLVNPVVADRGFGVGSRLRLARPEGTTKDTATLTVVGVADNAGNRSEPIVGFVPGALGTPPPVQPGGLDTTAQWLVGGGPVSWTDVKRLNRVGLVAASRAVLEDPPPIQALDQQISPPSSGHDPTNLAIAGLVATMVLLEVVLLAGPAFAVRATAQARSLALVAAVGGTPVQARRTILASGLLIGGLGAAGGIAGGILLGRAAVPLAQHFVGQRFGPLDVPWTVIAVVAVLGLASAVLAAYMPARAASRQDVVAVLGGRRGAAPVSSRSPLIGIVLIALGALAGVVGSVGGEVHALPLAASALLSVVGMLWLVGLAVALVARRTGGLPLPARFAARDAARNRTRTVPAVAAVAATVAGVVTLGIALSTQQAVDRRDYVAQLPSGWGAITSPDVAPGTGLRPFLRIADAQLGEGRAHLVRGLLAPRGRSIQDVAATAGGRSLTVGAYGSLGSPWLVGERVPAVLGVPEAQRRAADETLARGGAVAVVPAGQGRASGAVKGRLAPALLRDRDGSPVTSRALELPISVVTVPQSTAAAALVVSPEAVKGLGLRAAAVGVALEPGVSPQRQEALQEAALAVGPGALVYVERGFQVDQATFILRWILIALAGVLMLGGSLTATFLALSDARPDLATLAAVGAETGTRRRIAGGYALVVGGVGALLGAAVGLVPGLAVGRGIGYDQATHSTLIAMPWVQLGVLLIALPSATALVAATLTRSRLPLVARLQ